MALFQKRTDVSKITGLYTVGANKNVLVIGLGNVGKEYDGTRHNIGFEVVNFYAKTNDFPGWINKDDLKCMLSTKVVGGVKVILAKPTTYMNLSGQAAQAVQNFYRLYNPETLAVYDELDLDFGQIRTRSGGSAAGHNGVKSMLRYIGEDFSRLRIGVANEFSTKADSADFVLGKFTKEEQGKIPLVLRESTNLINDFVFGNFQAETRKVD